jgi:hypothetical protein
LAVAAVCELDRKLLEALIANFGEVFFGITMPAAPAVVPKKIMRSGHDAAR